MADVQRVHLVCREVTERGALPKRAQWYAAPTTPEDGAETVPDLREPDAGEDLDVAAHRMETALRTRALDHRYDDLVVVVGPAALRLLISALGGVHRDTVGSAALGPGATTVVGLPRAPRTIGLAPVGIVAVLLAIVDNSLWGAIGVPFLATGVVLVAAGGLSVSWRTRPYALALLKAAAIGALILILVLSSSRRFPTG